MGVRGGTGEPYSGGAAGKFQMTVYWHRGGIRGGTGDRMVGVRGGTGVRTVGERGGTGEPYSGGAWGCMAVLGCPPDPSNNSGGARGHPLAPLTN